MDERIEKDMVDENAIVTQAIVVGFTASGAPRIMSKLDPGATVLLMLQMMNTMAARYRVGPPDPPLVVPARALNGAR